MNSFGDQNHLSYVTFKVYSLAMDLLSTIVFTSFFIYTSFGTEVNISFDLEDSDVNEVVFVIERDIVLQCSVLGASSVYMISIGHENKDGILTATPNKMCSVHKINEVSINDGGEYTCAVSYLTVDGVMENKTKTLQLNVQDGEGPHCFRNGTSGNPFRVGDVLLLSCYCLGGDMPCRWIQTVPGSGYSSRVDTYGTGKRSNKVVIRILVKVGSLNSPTTTRYVCFSGGTSQQRCIIGPQNESSTDLVINSNAENTITDCFDDELASSSTSKTQEDVDPSLNTIQTSSRAGALPSALTPTSDITDKHDRGVVILTVVSVVSSVLVVILASTLIIVLLLFRKITGNRKNDGDPGTNHLSHNNKVFKNNQHKDEAANSTGSVDSHYYTAESSGDVSQTDHDSKQGDSVGTNTYMRAIIQM